MKSKNVFFFLFVATMAISLLAACAKPTTGTLFGRVEKNGSSVANEEVELVDVLEGGNEESVQATTDASGNFRFENIVPGRYYLLVGFDFPGEVSCRSEGSKMAILRMVATDTSGDPLTLALLSNSEEPWKIEAGDEIEEDIIVDCR